MVVTGEHGTGSRRFSHWPSQTWVQQELGMLKETMRECTWLGATLKWH